MFNTTLNDKAKILDKKHTIKTHIKDFWVLLHTTSVYLPADLTEDQATSYSDLIKGLIGFGTKFDKKFANASNEFFANNPIGKDKNDIILWTCNYHNHINELYDKDLFECDLAKIAKRWGNYNSIVNNII
jgi:hypothetical protein